MKTMKRMMAVLIVLAMLLSMACSSAYADITISGAKDGHTYTIYKLMDLNVAGDTYSYTATANWLNFFKTGEGAKYVTLDSANQVTWKYATSDDAAAKALAADAVTAAENEANPIANDGSKKADAAGDLTFEGADLTPGYYVVKSSAGTFLTLHSVYAGNLKLNEKNNLPNLDKYVKNANGGGYAEFANAEIGNTVEYKIEVAVEKGAKDYVITDTLPTGITLVGTPVVTGNDVAMSNTDYDVVVSGNGFTVTVQDTYLNKLDAAQKFTITYSGTVTNTITTGSTGNDNTAILMVSEVESARDTATVKSYEIGVVKKEEGTDKLLPNAKFKLYDKNNNTANNFVTIDANGVIGWGTEAEAKVFTTDSNGAFEIRGLMPGDYKLKETQAPAGYKLLNNDADAKINAENITVTVTNSKITAPLPDTGGMGTTLFYIFGGILMAGAAVLLVSRKRSAN